MKNSWELGLDYAIEAFEYKLGLKGLPFGQPSLSERGVSDGNEGVQWHIGGDKNSGKLWFGVNLEGITYKYWPVAVFIENELENSKLFFKLMELASTEDGKKIGAGFGRDVWQGPARLVVEERNIAGGLVRLSDLTDVKWKEMLEEARACLDPERNYRGRAKQSVTLKRSQKRVLKEVSPHLMITVWASMPDSRQEAELFVNKWFELLSPVYDIVKEQSLESRPLSDFRPSPHRPANNIRRDPLPPNVRHSVWRRDQGKCVVCGSNERLEFDHIIPLSKGGSNTERNLQLLCERCNREKSARIQ